MEIQNQVSRILRGNLARLRDVLDGAVSQGVGSLGQVADRVCEAFDFRDGRGRWQRYPRDPLAPRRGRQRPKPNLTT